MNDSRGLPLAGPATYIRAPQNRSNHSDLILIIQFVSTFAIRFRIVCCRIDTWDAVRVGHRQIHTKDLSKDEGQMNSRQAGKLRRCHE